MRKCNSCGIKKRVAEFCWRDKARTTKRRECRVCRAAYIREYRVKNPAKYRSYETNRDFEQRINRLEYGKRYVATHLEQTRLKHRRWIAHKRATDPQYKILNTLRARLSANVRVNREPKTSLTKNLLGCSISDFRLHLESQFKEGMMWSNYGKEWEIDHILPCAIFDLTKPEHLKRCFHFSNLQPLPITVNRKKGAKIMGNHQLEFI